MNYQSIAQQQYEDLRYKYLKQVEESGHENPLPYYDSNGLITIGVGFNLHEPASMDAFLSVALLHKSRPSQLWASDMSQSTSPAITLPIGSKPLKPVVH